jgi:hypothetical protein
LSLNHIVYKPAKKLWAFNSEVPVSLQVVQRLGSRGGKTALRSTILTKHCPNVVSRTFCGWRIFSGVISIRCSRARHPTTTWSAPWPLTSLSTCTVSTHFHLRFNNSSNFFLKTLCTTQPYALCTTQQSPLDTSTCLKHKWYSLLLKWFDSARNVVKSNICALLGYYAAYSSNYLPTFRDNLSVLRQIRYHLFISCYNNRRRAQFLFFFVVCNE